MHDSNKSPFFSGLSRSSLCPDCEMPKWRHIETWIGDIFDHLLPSSPPDFIPHSFERAGVIILETLFRLLGLTKWETDFNKSRIQLRTTYFMDEAKKSGISFEAQKGPFGYTNQFKMKLKGKTFPFEGLPAAEFMRKNREHIDDKKRTKRRLKEGGFPAAEGRSFWFFQKNKAVKYGLKIRFPLVVKPRTGSVSRHITTNIANEAEFKNAVAKAISYSPSFIVEKFLPDVSVFRATVIDFENVFCVEEIPANVAGDGKTSIQKLIEIKNSDPRRGEMGEPQFCLRKIIPTATTGALLNEKGYSLSSVPKKGEFVFLEKNPFLKLGCDLNEVTGKVHPDNIELFKNIAEFFDVRLVGIDFLCKDIGKSWKNQNCAVLELNSLPCIEMHWFVTSGAPQNAARALTEMVLKYYE